MEADSGVGTKELRVDGGASTNGWLMQLQADVLDIPVRRPALVETTALGAAGLAGIATGVWQSAADFLGVQEGGATLFEPSMDEDARTQLTSQWDRAVRAAIRWAQDV